MTATTLPALSMGLDTYKISIEEVFLSNRRKLVNSLIGVLQQNNCENEVDTAPAVLYLKGGRSETRNDTDHEPIFRQESYFLWLTGVMEPDCDVAIDLKTHQTTLFVPKLPQSYATVMGHIRTPQEWKNKYLVDHVYYTQDTEAHLLELLKITSTTNVIAKDKTLLLMHGTNSDSGAIYSAPTLSYIKPTTTIDTTTLFPTFAECRVMKSSSELRLLQHVSYLSSMAHVYTMRHVKPKMMEYQCESLFRHYCYYNFGSRLVGYTPICGCGPNSSILHYGHAGEPNARQIDSADEMLLMDMGAEYFGYGSDITCSYPAGGVFTEKHTNIYTAVLNAQRAVWAMIRPGVSWVDCHKAAEAEILTQLVKVGIVLMGSNDDVTIADLVEMRLAAVFMPHGLGHFIGIDTHDVGGYLPGHPERIQQPGLKSLRTSRILQENMVLTNEPGCYFIDWLLDEALASPTHGPHLNAVLLNEYRGFGGVRLEDVFCVTSDGFENFTMCPRTIQEVEHCMAGGKWPPLTDESPELGRRHLTDALFLSMSTTSMT